MLVVDDRETSWTERGRVVAVDDRETSWTKTSWTSSWMANPLLRLHLVVFLPPLTLRDLSHNHNHIIQATQMLMRLPTPTTTLTMRKTAAKKKSRRPAWARF